MLRIGRLKVPQGVTPAHLGGSRVVSAKLPPQPLLIAELGHGRLHAAAP